MDFAEKLKALAAKIALQKVKIKSEAQTKNSLIEPFIRALGYDPSNIDEVEPEFHADAAGNRKVDYALMQDGEPIMIVECKCCGVNLDESKRDQLHTYFVAVGIKIGILTDGIRYLFFSTAANGRNMDDTPFMEFNLEKIDETLVPELRKLCKGKFHLPTTLDTVNELKYKRKIKILLAENLEEPKENFIGYFMCEADVRATAKNRELFTSYTKRAFAEFITEQVDSRLRVALDASKTPPKEDDAKPATPPPPPEPKFTENEQLAYFLVKSMLMPLIAPERVTLKELSNHGCSTIRLDNTQRRPLIRLNFNKPEKLSISIGSTIEWINITKIDDILQHADAIRATAQGYDAGKE